MPSRAARPTAAVFLDFDGTIARADIVDAILEQYAEPAWRRIEEEWRAGRLGSRACLAQQMALVRASPREIDELIDRIGIDSGLVSLLGACAHVGTPVHIVSDGFDYCIRRLLARLPPDAQRLLADVTVSASHLEPAPHGLWWTRFAFPSVTCAHGCATCKPAVMRALAPAGTRTVFVGDGLSDRYAALEAETVFAKDALETYCVDHGLTHVRYETLADVATCIEEDMRLRA
jgi:2,3-diketo-5-methylthio-1-phosphopentane phosphatase